MTLRPIIILCTSAYSLGISKSLIVFIDVFLHYLIYSNNSIIASFIFLDYDKFMIFFALSYYFSKQALEFLPNSQNWLRLLRIYLYVSFTLQTAGAIATIIVNINEIVQPDSAKGLCG